MHLDPSLLDGLHRFAKGEMSADEWRAWWEANSDRIKPQVKPGEFLRMKPRKQDPIPSRAICQSYEGVCRALDARAIAYTATGRFARANEQEVTDLYGHAAPEPVRQLSYSTLEPISTSSANALQAEAEEVNATNDWWCEGICFFDFRNEKLCGATKLFVVGFSTIDGEYTDIEPAEDLQMARRDLDILVEHLERWSLNYALTWELCLGSQVLDTVSNGKAGDNLTAFLDSIASPASAEQARAISKKYAMRGK